MSGAPGGRLARATQILLAGEIGLALFIAWLCWISLLPGKAVLMFALTPYLLLRAAVLGRCFQLAWQNRSRMKGENPRRPSMAWVRAALAEYLALPVIYSGLLPFEQWLVPQAPEPVSAGKGLPVVLVHGCCSNRAAWYFFARLLQKLGVGPLYAVTLEPLLGPIEASAPRLSQLVEQICEASGKPRVVLVGHGMGGLVCRMLVHSSFGQKRVARVITLGSPHQGTAVVRDVEQYGENLRQMTLQSKWSARMAVFERVASPLPIVAVLSPQDELIAPQQNGALRYPNAQNFVFKGLGHFELLLSRKVAKAIAPLLQQA